MSAGVVAAPGRADPVAPPGALAVAALLVRFRLRSLWNGVRLRGRGRFPTLIVFVGLLTSLAYMGLFYQAFVSIVATTDFAGQVGALALVTGIIAFGSLTAKAASSEAVMAGSAENEFLMARPVSLPTLVAARALAESATDPFGALFLFPVLFAAALAWQLSPAAWILAVLASMITQVAISALSQATQIALVRVVPRRRRRLAWMLLRLLASLSLAGLWMMGTWVMRAPPELGRALAPLAPLAKLSPGALVAGPLAAFARGDALAVAVRLGALALASGGALLLAVAVARRAGARGWEEAGATWADVKDQPGARPHGRLLTAATKDLALITRDRSLLVALVAMPTIFVGMQLFGSVGWTWSTANLQRVSYLTFSLMLYMVTIGPLTHMQAERRAFWILRSVPVPIGYLLAAKARAWSAVVGGVSLVVFTVLSLGTPVPSAGAWISTALLVVGGSVGMTWLAVAVASRAADLSDEQRPAIGPATIYTFLLLGALYNTVLAGDLPTRVRAIVLYAFTLAAYWQAGVAQARVCLDPEVAPARRVVLADGAMMVVVFALGQRGAAQLVEWAQAGSVLALATALLVRAAVVTAVGLAALAYLARRPRPLARRSLIVSVAFAILAGGIAGAILRATGFVPDVVAVRVSRPVMIAVAAALLLGEELVFRGTVQRSLEESLGPHLGARAVAAGVSVLVALVATRGVLALSLGALMATHIVAAGTHVVTGRTSAAWLARVAVMFVTTSVALAAS